MSPVYRLNKSQHLAKTLAQRAQGRQKLFGPLAVVTLWLLPIGWVVPLFETEILFFLRDRVSILIGIESLLRIDLFLTIVVIIFAIVAPALKAFMTIWTWYRCPIVSLNRQILRLSILGKLAMAEVFLIAIGIIVFKGIGLGEVRVLWGLYFYTFVILLSIMQPIAFQWIGYSIADRDGVASEC